MKAASSVFFVGALIGCGGQKDGAAKHLVLRNCVAE